MSAFAVTEDGHVLARFDEAETNILLSLSRQFTGLLTTAAEPAAALDPALERLFPDAYRDDPDASAEFSRYTRTDLVARKTDAASAVQRALAGEPPMDGDPRADDIGAVPSDGTTGGIDGILLDTATGWSWLRHLTDLRLTVAARLGVVDDPHAFDEDPDPDLLSEEDLLARSVFDWLGYVQELLIAALEEAVGTAADAGNGPTGPSSASV